MWPVRKSRRLGAVLGVTLVSVALAAAGPPGDAKRPADEQVHSIELPSAIELHQVAPDSKGRLWVSDIDRAFLLENGRLVSELVVDGKPSLDLHGFRLSRFAETGAGKPRSVL